MTGVVKPFDKSLNDKNDPPARNAIKAYFLKYLSELVIKANKIKEIDFNVYDSNGKLLGYLEVQRAENWIFKESSSNFGFPYPKFVIPGRKEKYSLELPTLFVCVSGDSEAIAFCWEDNLKDEYLRPCKNKYAKLGELEYAFSPSLCSFDKI